MAACHGHQHTNMCGISVLLCVLFHVHLHLAHASDMASGTTEMSPPYSSLHALDTNETDVQALATHLTRLLFEKYSTDSVMNLEQFEQFLVGIGLGNIGHSNEHDSQNDNSSHNHSHEHIHKRSLSGSDNHHNSVHEKNELVFHDRKKQRVRRDNSDDQFDTDECFTSNDYLSLTGSNSLAVEKFRELFPVFLHQLDSGVCDELDSHYKHPKPVPFWALPASVWVCSLVAITVISLVGLLSVVIIPLTSKVIYNHLLQFLVALAVGSLTGDACLHLLPHALAGDEHSHLKDDASRHSDHSAVYKGLVALAGIYVFFLIERVMKMYSSKKRAHNKKIRDEEIEQESGLVKDNVNAPLKTERQHSTSRAGCDEKLMVVHKEVKYMAKEAHDDVHRNCDVDVNETVGGHGHHGHSHGTLPRSVAQVAWMVIMGDGIHNFGDGLAIGAAFANSISVGLSTTVAVFCHELPHEIGDFAVLLRAGMSVKQAIVYNIVSSILALIGMLIGLMVGNLSSASLWIFALIGGMFIYVALVDMVPELTAVDPKSGEHPLVHFVLQNAGMLLGFTIMLLIAIFEDDIKFPVL